MVNKTLCLKLWLLFQLFSIRLFSQELFIAPVDTPFQLSGSFGELRLNHFHSGLDFRTGGKEGASVYATLNGWISRIKVSSGGFGNVIYLDHAQGYTSVYAHLHHFNESLASYVDSAQRANERFEVELFPDSGRFYFFKGQILAISGNSGASEAPHLHFEIRDRSSQEPLNPMRFIPDLYDSTAPIAQSLVLYYYLSGRYIQFDYIPLNKKENTIYTIDTFRDSLYVGLIASDIHETNYLGIYSIKLSREDSSLFFFNFDRFSFDESRYANAHSDFSHFPPFNSRLHRLFRLPGDSCSIFKQAGNGLILLRDHLQKAVQIEIKDGMGNTSSVRVKFRKKDKVNSTEIVSSGIVIPFGKKIEKTFSNGISVRLPASALYQSELINDTLSKREDSLLSDIFPVLTDMGTSLHKPGRLTIPMKNGLPVSKEKILVIRLDPNNKIKETIKPDSTNEKFVESNFRNGGYYAITLDTVAPSVKNFSIETDPVDLKHYCVLTTKDDLSGLQSYRVEVNNRWVPASYDIKTQKIKWPRSKEKNGPDFFSITLTDQCNNSFHWTFAD